MKKYSLGLDFGTLSVRALLVDVNTGEEAAQSTMPYSHGVMSENLNGKKLPADWALQHPEDYVNCMKEAVQEAMALSHVTAEQVVGIGIDFTACTMLPVTADGTPLCCLEQYADNPHAYVKLWKHHAAEKEAQALNHLAQARGEPWLSRYGGKISSEWLIPKIWNILKEAPEIYAAADRFMEAADWVAFKLTGTVSRSVCFAGYKGIWSRGSRIDGAFLEALDPRLRNLEQEKLNAPIKPIGGCVGGLNARGAQLLGLQEGTPVAVPIIDAHAGVLAANVSGDGQMLMNMGTSTCHMMVSEREVPVPGISGVVEDGILPGMFGYEAGQACVGDHFSWFVENCCPESYAREANERNLGLHQLLTEKAQRLSPGENGLIALDWWNGCRSTLVDSRLTGAIFGMTLATRPEDIYRALIEATAFGTRVIVENYNQNGVPVKQISATGGIALKNPMLMQIYADVLNMPLTVCEATQGPALGAAILGAVAATAARGGYDSVHEAMDNMSRKAVPEYSPIPENVRIYETMYQLYRELYNKLGKDSNSVLKKVKEFSAL